MYRYHLKSFVSFSTPYVLPPPSLMVYGLLSTTACTVAKVVTVVFPPLPLVILHFDPWVLTCDSVRHFLKGPEGAFVSITLLTHLPCNPYLPEKKKKKSWATCVPRPLYHECSRLTAFRNFNPTVVHLPRPHFFFFFLAMLHTHFVIVNHNVLRLCERCQMWHWMPALEQWQSFQVTNAHIKKSRVAHIFPDTFHPFLFCAFNVAFTWPFLYILLLFSYLTSLMYWQVSSNGTHSWCMPELIIAFFTRPNVVCLNWWMLCW